MSLLDRLGRGHLDDSQFARLWTSEDGSHPHLEACADCRARYAAFERWLAGVGDELRAEADDAFTPDRLAVQQAQITRRLETLARPARVIAFPKAARAVISGNSHVRRWVTVAAAASLIAGFGLGQVMPIGTVLRNPAAISQPKPLTKADTVAIAKDLTPPPAASPMDEDLLSDDFTRPRVSTLSALDEMTPHVRDSK